MRFAPLSSILLSVLALNGCGKQGNAPAPTDTPVAVTTTPSNPEVPAAVVTPPAVPAGEVLVSRLLDTSDRPQTVSLPNNVKLTIPGGLLKRATQLTITAGKSPGPPVLEGLPVLLGFDISLGDLHDLEKPVVLEVPLEAKHIPHDMPTDGVFCPVYFDSARRAWVELPGQFDASKRSLTVQISHLSWLEIWHFGPYMYVPGQVLRIMAKDFWIFYNLADVQRESARYVPRQASTDPMVPPFISDLRDFIHEALGTYRILDFRPHTEKLWILVTKGRIHSEFVSLHGRVFISMSSQSADELAYAVSHELFHSIQHRHYNAVKFWWWPVPVVGGPTGPTFAGTQKWWLEATAEYAACRIALPSYPEMGKQRGGDSRFLTLPLTTFGLPDDPDLLRYHQYQVAHFLSFLCRRGVALNPDPILQTETFKLPPPVWADFPLGKDVTISAEAWYFRRMYAAAAEGGGNALQRLNEFLTTRHGREHNLDAMFREFTLFYLFDSASPTKRPAADRVNPFSLEKRATPLQKPTDSPTFVFSLPGPHTAKAWAVHPDLPPPGKDPRTINVLLPRRDLPDGTAVIACVLPRDERTSGPPEIAGTMIGSADRDQVLAVSLKPEDGLYIVVFNHGTDTREIEVQVKPSPIEIKSIDPPAGSRYSSITIQGTGFGAERPLNVSEGLFFRNKRVTQIDSWSDTQIKARVPDSPTGKFVVKRDRQASNPYPFTVEVPPMTAGWYELRVFSIYLRNMMPSVPPLFLEITASGTVTVHARRGGKLEVVGGGTVKPNPNFTSNRDIYLWNVAFEYAYQDYPLVNDQRTKYVLTGKVGPFGVEGEVRGGGFTRKFQPAGARAHETGTRVSPATPLDPQLPNARQPHDLIDGVRSVYRLELTWGQNEEDIAYLNEQIANLEEQLKELKDIQVPAAAPAPGNEEALRMLIKDLDAKLQPLVKDLNATIGKIEEFRSRGRQLRTWGRQPANLPYDVARPDLEAMEQSLGKTIAEQGKKRTDLGTRRDELIAEYQKALAAKTARNPTANTEKARLQAIISSLEAQIDLTQQRRPGRDKKLEEITRAVKSLAPRPAPAESAAGQGVRYSVMHNLVPTATPK